MDNAIGGYFELELPPGRGEYYPEACRFQSARAAFLALLMSSKPSRVWAPWYICDSMIEPLHLAGVPISRYAIDAGLNVADHFALAADEWILYVNYFGLCDANVDSVLNRFPRNQVVIDNAQAFFSRPRDCLATIYSPRKFFGVPDGGYLVSSLHVPEPAEEDQDSVGRCAHLLKRLAATPESGYADYGVAEESFVRQSPKRMSQFTRRILSSIDYENVKARRMDNFAALRRSLGALNEFGVKHQGNSVPLCYPFYGAPNGVKAELIRRRIFVPSYWPDMSRTDATPKFENEFSRSCVFLPCDQRLGSDDVNKMTTILIHAAGVK